MAQVLQLNFIQIAVPEATNICDYCDVRLAEFTYTEGVLDDEAPHIDGELQHSGMYCTPCAMYHILKHARIHRHVAIEGHAGTELVGVTADLKGEIKSLEQFEKAE
jgi:hypothetical protein